MSRRVPIVPRSPRTRSRAAAPRARPRQDPKPAPGATRKTSPGRPPTAKGQRTRRRLLDAAESAFGEDGFERASIADITRRADVAMGTYYVYFANKRAIFAELVEELGHGLRRRLAEAVHGLTDRMEIEQAGCLAFLEYVRAHKHLYRIVRQAEFVDEALHRDYYRRLASSYADGLAQAIDDGQLTQAIDPETLAYTLMGVFDFLGMRWVLWEDRLPPRRVLEDVFAFIRRGVARDGERERLKARDTPKAPAQKPAGRRSRTKTSSRERSPGKKTSAKKAAANKTSAKQSAPKKKSSSKRSVSRKGSSKKTSSKKAAQKRSAPKKSSPKKPSAKKSSSKKPSAR